MNTNNKFFKAYKLLKDKIYFILISLISNEEKKFKFIYKNKYTSYYENGQIFFEQNYIDGKKIKLYKSRIGRAEIKLENNDAILHLFPNENYKKDEG